MDTKPDDILIVDDTPANLKLISQILTTAGYHIRVAANGSHALASVEMASPDLILLDVKMPGLDGYQVCAKLKSNPKTAEIPVIFISALDDIKDKLEGFQAGGLDYITKPFQLEEVLARVKTQLELRNARQKLQSANARMAHELNLAALMQANFIPQKMPQVAGWQFDAVLQPARETSGDFFDIFLLPDGKLAFMIADVVDKGVAAALFMVLSWSLVRELVQANPLNPDLVMEKVNQRILSIIEGLEFVTIFLGVIDPQTGDLLYANAGHNPPIHMQQNSGDAVLLTRTGMALGVSEEASWTMQQVRIHKGDTIVLYTDGITEVCNQDGEVMDFEKFKACAMQYKDGSAAEVKQGILESARKFLNGHTQQDDITLLVLKRNN